MSRAIVLVPTYYRPEFLWLCLDSIAKSDGGRSKEIWVSQDHHTDSSRNDSLYQLQAKENAEVMASFQGTFKNLLWIDRKPNSYLGNSFNCLELYKEAYSTDANFVYFVEDDVLVAKDFFRWHETVQEQGDYFCSVGWHCVRNKGYLKNHDVSAYIESSVDYASLGVCWRREKLAPIIPHCCNDYYEDVNNYVLSNFPIISSDRGFNEQDGLIQKVLKQGNGQRLVAWPCLKRVYHIGITGYHRPDGYKFIGSLKERIQQLTDAIEFGQLTKLSTESDIDIPRGFTPEWNGLHVVQQFN